MNRRRGAVFARRSGGAALVLLAGVLGGTGCREEGYCFVCPDGQALAPAPGGTGGEPPIILPGGTGGTGPASPPCEADVANDVANCGECGHRCEVLGAFPACREGFCVIDTCAPGQWDLDGQLANGCEYGCTPSTVGGQALELCDGLDNDCNGQVDELHDLATDAMNCGVCGHVCQLPNAESRCTAGACEGVSCHVGFHDVDGDLADPAGTGCELACTVTNSGFEVCDLRDNDCNGAVDEGIDTATDDANCGQCGNDCQGTFHHGVAHCMSSACEFSGCEPGYFDLDGEEPNGCEYGPCTPTGAELCNGRDDDCDGLVDEGSLPTVGDACGNAAAGECKPGVLECTLGVLRCAGEVAPTDEYCDGLDNDCTLTPDEGCAAAQTSDRRLDTGSGSAVGQAVTAQLSVASAGSAVFAAYLDRRSGNADVRYNVSVDSGATWASADVGVATASANEVEPWVFASTSRAYVAYEKFSGVYRGIHLKSASSPGFSSFGAEVRVDRSPAKNDAFYVRGVVAKSGAADTLALVWQRLDLTTGKRDVYLQASKDGGASWLSQDLRVNGAAGAADQPRIATDGAGRVFLAWRDQRSGKSEIFTDTYDTGTGTLRGNRALSAGTSGTDPTLAADGAGNVHVGWTDLRAAKSAIRVSTSKDSGATYPADGTLVNPDSTFADASEVALAADSGRVVAVWADTRSGRADIRANRSVDGGTTWRAASARVDLGKAPGASRSSGPRVTFGAGGDVLVVWRDTRSGAGDIYANHSWDEGQSFQPRDLRLDVGGTTPSAPSAPGAADSQTPFLVAPGAGTRGVAVWLDFRTSAGANGQRADVYSSFFE